MHKLSPISEAFNECCKLIERQSERLKEQNPDEGTLSNGNWISRWSTIENLHHLVVYFHASFPENMNKELDLLL